MPLASQEGSARHSLSLALAQPDPIEPGDDRDPESIISFARPERQKRLRLPFSPPSRLSRAKSSANSVGEAAPLLPSCQLGASVFYLRANSAPTGQPDPLASPQPSPQSLPASVAASSLTAGRPSFRLSKDELATGRSSLRRPGGPRERSASPPPSPEAPPEKEKERSSFQRLQDSWKRRSDRASASPLLPRPPLLRCSSPSPSSSSSSSSSFSSTPAASPRSEEGQKTPTQASPPVLIRARAVPAQAPPPVAPRASLRHSGASLPEYENLEVFRRSCGLAAAAPEPRKRRSGAQLARRSHMETPVPFQRGSPIRQSLPTRMDRLLTRFPTDMRCYLPETNV